MKKGIVLPVLLALSCACVETPPPPISPVSPGAPTSVPAPPSSAAPATAGLAYPVSRRIDAKDVLFGVTVEDPYRWLEDAKSAEVVAWSKAQDDLARAELAKLGARAELA